LTLDRPGRSDYTIEIFRQKLVGEQNRMDCSLTRDSDGVLILSDKDVIYSAPGKVATCSFPKLAMKVGPSGVVRWHALTGNVKNAEGAKVGLDSAPDNPLGYFPHL